MDTVVTPVSRSKPWMTIHDVMNDGMQFGKGLGIFVCILDQRWFGWLALNFVRKKWEDTPDWSSPGPTPSSVTVSVASVRSDVLFFFFFFFLDLGLGPVPVRQQCSLWKQSLPSVEAKGQTSDSEPLTSLTGHPTQLFSPLSALTFSCVRV